MKPNAWSGRTGPYSCIAAFALLLAAGCAAPPQATRLSDELPFEEAVAKATDGLVAQTQTLPAFLAKVEASAHERVFIQLRHGQLKSPSDPLWELMVGTRRARQPEFRDLWNLLEAMGIHAEVDVLEYEGFQAWPSLDDFIAEFQPPLKDHWDQPKAGQWIAANLVDEADGRLVSGRGRHTPAVADRRPARGRPARSGAPTAGGGPGSAAGPGRCRGFTCAWLARLDRRARSGSGRCPQPASCAGSCRMSHCCTEPRSPSRTAGTTP